MKQAALKQRSSETGRGRGASESRPFFSPVQTKLNVSRPGEKLEQEADSAADAVVHKRGPMTRGVSISKRMTPIAQRMEEDAQSACERSSDPAWTEHEPASMRSGMVEDEPLQMMEETPQEPIQAMEEEEAQAKEDEAQAAVEEEAQTKEDETQAKEDETQAKEDDTQAKEEDTQAKEEDTQAKEEGAQAKAEDAQSMEEQAQAKDEDAQSKDEETQSSADEGELQRKEARPALSARATRMQNVENQLRASRGRGNPLPDGIRQKMEQGLNADFSGVRIHTDHPAFLMTKLLNAKAFTSGRDIYFSPHRFAPGTKDGDHLLAHELAHTLQQAAVPVREDAVAQRAPEDDQQSVRPESLQAIRIAYSFEGKINSNFTDQGGERIGWPHLKTIFKAAFDRHPFPDALLKKPMAHPQDLPHWCGIFAWHALREANFPLPPWSLGQPMLNHTQVRPPGEIPQVGDIAYRDKLPWMPDGSQLTHHQALVAAVEPHESAKNKDFKKIEITTIDGNTAGSNNMGGQVQETKQPLGNWKHFFDPGGKVNMPASERVIINRAAPDLGPDLKSEGATPQPEADTAQTDVSALETDVAPTPEALPGADADVAVDLDLPPPVEVEAEPAAKVEKVALEGKSDKATAAFTKAAPSAMALSAPDLGGALDKKTRAEKKETAKETPELKAETGGTVDPAITPASEIPVPEDVTLQDKGDGPEVGDLAPGLYTEKGTAPDTSKTYVGREMQKQNSGGFLDWLKNSFKSLMSSIQVKDNSVNTSAGPKKRVALSGDADVGRMARQRGEGTERLRQERDAKVADFKTHPGQSNIQPRKVDQNYKAEQAPEPAEPIADISPGADVDDYASAEWPADFRDAADKKMAKKMEGGLSKARADAEKAGSDRDAEKSAAIADAERKTAAANKAADDKQRDAVVAGRGDVARRQGQAVQDAYDNVATFSTDAAGQQTDKGKAIAKDVKESEGKADKDLADGEKEAGRLKTEAEKNAATEKKTKLEDKENDDSWWGRLTKAVVNTIVSAIDGIFTVMRGAIKTAIENAKKWAVEKINDARNRAIKALNGFRDWAKDKVNTYVKDRYPGLAKALNTAIDTTVDLAEAGVNAAADGAIVAVEKLADALAGALDALLARFQAALKLVVGAIGALLTGDFVGALKLAFEAGCALAGVNPKPILDFLDRAGQQILSILKKPGPFINNLFKAVGLGIRQFADNFVQHFKSGVISWLTGALSAVPITLPAKWDIKGFFSLVAQILGLTYDNIKARIIKKFPKAAGVFEKIEKGWKFVKMLLNRDYAGLWAEVKAKLADLKQTILGAIQKWTLLNVIKQGVMWLLSMLNPASAIVRLLKMLADLVFWLVENFQRIKAFVLSVYGAISNIAAGIIKPAAKAVEDALARALPIVISFVASAIGLSDIAGAIQGVLKKIQAPVNKAIDTLIDKVVAFAKKIIAKVVGGAKKAGKKVKDAALSLIRWWTEKRRFRTKDGGDHKIYYKGEGTKADLWIASTPKSFPDFLSEHVASEDKDQGKLAKQAQKRYGKATVVDSVLGSERKMEKLQEQRKKAKAAGNAAKEKEAKNAVKREVTVFRNQLKQLSDIIKQMNVEDEAAAITDAKFTDGGYKQVTAMPLTFLPGKDTGSSPSDSPDGWPHAQKINEAEKKTVWIRGHLLNDNVHGPGKNKNLVPIPQSVNRTMETQAESDIKTRVHSKKEKLYFRATATYWPPAIPDTKGFPRKLVLVWHKAEKQGAGWKKTDHLGTKTFNSPEPPQDAGVSAPGIISGSGPMLVSAINTETVGAKVTPHFVNYLKAQAPYAAAGQIRTKLTQAQTDPTKPKTKWDKLNPSEKENRGKQIYRTISAVNAKKVELT